MIKEILYYLFLVDSVAANVVIWADGRWFVRHFRMVSRWFPPAKGWAVLYLGMVLLWGWTLGSWPF